MNANKLLMLTGVAMVIAVSGGSQLANAGIDAGGKPGSSGDKSSYSKGSVNRFGDLYVNGVRFNTDNAEFIIDRRFGRESDISVGQVVSIFGTIDSDGQNGTALTVRYDDSVAGPVSRINTRSGRVSVLGQTVIINSHTVFSMASNATSIVHLKKNDGISVSGFKDASGNIVATFIGDSDAGNDLELTGTISGTEAGNMTFTVNELQVDYSSANLYDLNSGVPTVGQEVEISGARFNASGQLVADSVWAVEPEVNPGNGAIGEVEGYVTRRLSWMDFEVGGTRIKLTWQTRFVNDSFAGVKLNRKVEVEGTFNAQGELVAERINFEREDVMRKPVQPVRGDGVPGEPVEELR
jgi:Domain of unknown function (DUF5666)